MAEKRLKLVPRNWNRAIYILFLLTLLSVEVDLIPQEQHGTKNPVSFCSFSNSKVVFTLLTEVIAVYIGHSTIHIQGTNLQKLIEGLLRVGQSWDRSGSKSESLSLQNGLHNPLQLILGILGDMSSNGKDDSDGRYCP